MSTARLVPEIDHVPGPGPLDVWRSAPPRALVTSTLRRIRAADGLSHTRATAFQTVLAAVPGAIAFVGLASVLAWESMRRSVERATEAIAPGVTSEVFQEAFDQGTDGSGAAWGAVGVGMVAWAMSGTTAFGQVERTANRIYGVETDRPALRKYGLAFLLWAATAIATMAVLLVAGALDEWEGSNGGLPARAVRLAAWPLGSLCLVGGFVLVFSVAPRRRQPPFRWLIAGASVSTVAVVIVSVALSVYLDASGSFGDTYGPLAGLLGVLLWAYGMAAAVYLGVAFSAQLEAVRAGAGDPSDEEKASMGEPGATAMSYGAALAGGDPMPDSAHRAESGRQRVGP